MPDYLPDVGYVLLPDGPLHTHVTEAFHDYHRHVTVWQAWQENMYACVCIYVYYILLVCLFMFLSDSPKKKSIKTKIRKNLWEVRIFFLNCLCLKVRLTEVQAKKLSRLIFKISIIIDLSFHFFRSINIGLSELINVCFC